MWCLITVKQNKKFSSWFFTDALHVATGCSALGHIQTRSQCLINDFAAAFCRDGLFFRFHFKCFLTFLKLPPEAKRSAFFERESFEVDGTGHFGDGGLESMRSRRFDEMHWYVFRRLFSGRLVGVPLFKITETQWFPGTRWAVVHLLPDLASKRSYRFWAPDREALHYIITWNQSPFQKHTIYSPKSI